MVERLDWEVDTEVQACCSHPIELRNNKAIAPPPRYFILYESTKCVYPYGQPVDIPKCVVLEKWRFW